MKKATLRINVKQPWFSMEQSGEKDEEYRDIKPYWVRRLIDLKIKMSDEQIQSRIDEIMIFSSKIPYEIALSFGFSNNFKFVEIKNGWARNGKPAPIFTRKCEGIRIGVGKPEWGASGVNQFIIGLGAIVG